MLILLYAYVTACGLIVGSYLNVLIHRLPRGTSTVLPRSRCPQCNALIRPVDNIPLISYFLLGGRCRDCPSPIHWRYPLVEAITGGLFLASVLRFDFGVAAVVACGLSALLVTLAVIDAEHYVLPDVLTLSGVVIGLALHGLDGFGLIRLPWTTWRGALVGAVLGAGLLLAVSGAWWLVKRTAGMGLGDVKMLAMIGAFLGWQGVIVSLFIAALGGSLVGALGMLRGRLSAESRLPFGVFLALGAGVAIFYGPPLLRAYFGLMPELEGWLGAPRPGAPW
ncbi:MAG: prepilin peptidase [Acidobacteriota bacterium]